MEEMQSAAAPAPRPSMMHVLIILLLLISLAGIGYVIFGQMGQNEALDHQSEHLDALGIQIEEISKPAGNTNAPAPTASNEYTLYTDNTYGFRIATTPACKDVFAVRRREGKADLREMAGFDMFVPHATDWPKDSPFRSFGIVSGQDLDKLQNSGDYYSGTGLFLTKEGNWFVDYGAQDAPTDRDLTAANGALCNSPVIQPLPY